jgi:hypothetical protein
MLLRPTHSRVIMPAVITGRDSTARYSSMRGPTAAWRAMAQGGPHQEAMALSLRSRLLPPDDQEGNEESPRDSSALGQANNSATVNVFRVTLESGHRSTKSNESANLSPN